MRADITFDTVVPEEGQRPPTPTPSACRIALGTVVWPLAVMVRTSSMVRMGSLCLEM